MIRFLLSFYFKKKEEEEEEREKEEFKPSSCSKIKFRFFPSLLFRTVFIRLDLQFFFFASKVTLGGVTSGLKRRENGRRFLTPLVCAGYLLKG